jgi:hypothetical protein
MSDEDENKNKGNLAGVLGGIAAIIVAIGGILTIYFNNKPGKTASAPLPVPPALVVPIPTPKPRPKPHPASIDGYWHGDVVLGVTLTANFHLIVNNSVVTGALQSPCQGPSWMPIDSGSWTNDHLVLHVTQLGQGFNPVTVDAYLVDKELKATFSQPPYDVDVTLQRGQVQCTH